MFTRQFKILLFSVAGFLVAGGLLLSQVLSDAHLVDLQKQINQMKAEQLVVKPSPTATPVASPTAALKFTRPVQRVNSPVPVQK